MKLLSLKLKNFKGIRSFELQANGEDIAVYGDNGTGKSTLFDAFTWLLFSKDSQNKADFDIKTLDKNNQPLHGLEHEVEAVFDVDGRPLSLKKVYSEKWTRKRGSATAEFSGHTTDHFLNGVPVKELEYKTKINEIANETTFKLLTNPTYFNAQLSWQDRRKILLAVCGDIRDEDVIASNPGLNRLPEILQGRTIEDHRKVIAARRTKINDELQKIPVRISEVQQSLPDLSNLIPEALPADIQMYKTMIQAKQNELTAVKNGGEVAEKTKQLRQAEADLLKLENDFRAGIDAQLRNQRIGLNQLEDKAAAMRREINSFCDYQETITQFQKMADKSLAEAAKLRKEWADLHAREFEFAQSETCPTCGQMLPQEQLQVAREKALADFNLQKSTKLEEITQKGQTLVVDAGSNQAKIEELRVKEQEDLKRRQVKEGELKDLELMIRTLQGDIDRQAAADCKGTPSYICKLREKESLEAAIRDAQAGNSDAIETLQNEIDRLIQDKEALEKALASVEFHERGLTRIDELKQQERDLAGEYERLEGELFMTEEFIRSKVNLLEEKINSRFKMARFKLFEIQINGGIMECCETLYNGVPYNSNLNTGAQINVGLDIINTLSEHYGFDAPIFIDNAESVTQLIETKGQKVCLVVSRQDKKLRLTGADAAELKEAV